MTVLAKVATPEQQARLVDGASEVHKGVLANCLIEERDAFWRWDERALG